MLFLTEVDKLVRCTNSPQINIQSLYENIVNHHDLQVNEKDFIQFSTNICKYMHV